MSQITLKPLDDGHKAVEIPLGKTTIGRGPFLGCSDKKVSRNHAVLEVTCEGEVFLTPTHVNPCFLKPTDDNPGQILKKDVPCKLENGDTFSLLPKAYRYQLIVENDSSPNKSCSQQEDIMNIGKTNGSALDESYGTNKEHDVFENACAKEEISNVEKNCSPDENLSSKKLTEIKDNGDINCSKDKEGNDSGEPSLKDVTQEETKLSLGENLVLTTKEKEDAATESSAEEKIVAELKENHSCAEVCTDAEDKSAGGAEKIVKDSMRLISRSSDEESERRESPPLLPNEKTYEMDSQPAVEDSHNESSNELLESEIAEKEEVASISTKTKTESTAPTIKPKRATKRKAATETSSKSKIRKKTLKTNFDDAKAGTSRQPGRTSSRTNRQTRQGLSLEDFIVSDDDEWQSEPQQRRRCKRKGGGRRGEDSGSDWEIEHKKPKKSLQKGWSGSESGSEQGNQNRKKGSKSRRKNDKPEEENMSEDPCSSNTIKLKIRIPCTYGKKCFRRNANHKEQFSHPGDSDYASETESKNAISESEDETPKKKKECPYGANCFRKNPQHTKDFKHTKIVRPQREAARQADEKAKSSGSSGGIDSYDLNDSFLNDDSADEYKPVDSGSDYESGEKMKKHTKVKKNKNKQGKKL